MQVTKGESEWTQNEIGAQVVDDLLISVTLYSKGVDRNLRLWMHLFTTVGANFKHRYDFPQNPCLKYVCPQDSKSAAMPFFKLNDNRYGFRKNYYSV